MFKDYPEPIMRADAIRYFLLYEYGGVYVYLDFEALRPLDEFERRQHKGHDLPHDAVPPAQSLLGPHSCLIGQVSSILHDCFAMISIHWLIRNH